MLISCLSQARHQQVYIYVYKYCHCVLCKIQQYLKQTSPMQCRELWVLTVQACVQDLAVVDTTCLYALTHMKTERVYTERVRTDTQGKSRVYNHPPGLAVPVVCSAFRAPASNRLLDEHSCMRIVDCC